MLLYLSCGSLSFIFALNSFSCFIYFLSLLFFSLFYFVWSFFKICPPLFTSFSVFLITIFLPRFRFCPFSLFLSLTRCFYSLSFTLSLCFCHSVFVSPTGPFAFAASSFVISSFYPFRPPPLLLLFYITFFTTFLASYFKDCFKLFLPPFLILSLLLISLFHSLISLSSLLLFYPLIETLSISI